MYLWLQKGILVQMLHNSIQNRLHKSMHTHGCRLTSLQNSQLTQILNYLFIWGLTGVGNPLISCRNSNVITRRQTARQLGSSTVAKCIIFTSYFRLSSLIQGTKLATGFYDCTLLQQIIAGILLENASLSNYVTTDAVFLLRGSPSGFNVIRRHQSLPYY